MSAWIQAYFYIQMGYALTQPIYKLFKHAPKSDQKYLIFKYISLNCTDYITGHYQMKQYTNKLKRKCFYNKKKIV